MARRPTGFVGRFILPSALLVTCLSSGCSAISATLACRDAERAIEHGAATTPRGVYQMTLARAYLDKAREQASEAHYGSASNLAEAAKLAVLRATSPGSSQERAE
jgi:hypothetical protein